MRRFPTLVVLPLVALAAGAGGCGLGPDEVVPVEAAAVGDDAPNEGSPEMRGYSWVIDGQLAGMPRPGGREPLEVDLSFLEGQGIDLLVSLTEVGTDPVAAASHGIDVLHLPVKDFTAPTLLQLREFVIAATRAMAEGRAVGVHCGAGKGRTGTFLSSYFVAQGMTGDEAIEHVRALRPGSVETAAQAQAVRDYAAWARSAAAAAAAP